MNYPTFAHCVIIAQAKSAPAFDKIYTGGYAEFTKFLEDGYEKKVISDSIDCYYPRESGELTFVYLFRSDGILIGGPFASVAHVPNPSN